jgi:hypothetical protein
MVQLIGPMAGPRDPIDLGVPICPMDPEGLAEQPWVVAEKEDPARIDVITKR